jgi:Tfp pilus assembly protein PilZ
VKHRRHRRVGAKGVTAHVDGHQEGLIDPADDCNIENISVGGLFIRTTSPMPIGMPVRVDLTKPGFASSLQVCGRVVSVVSEADSERLDSPPGVGIEFDPMPIDQEKQLHALLRGLGLTDLAEPTELEPNSLFATTNPDTAQVASNVRGLLEMLTDALQKVKERDEEILKLKAEIRKLKTASP